MSLDAPGARFPVVGIGTSAGGIEALKLLFQSLPRDLGAALVIVMHIGPKHESALADILLDTAGLPVVRAFDGQVLQPGKAYILSSEVPSRDVLEMAVAVSGAMTVSGQAARSIMLLAGG